MYSYSLGTFGVLVTFLSLFAIKKNYIVVFRILPFLLLVYCQLFFANGTTRLVVLAFPVIILLVLDGVAVISEKLHISPMLFVPLPLLIVILNLATKRFSASIKVQCLVLAPYLALLLLVWLLSRKRQILFK